MAGSGSLIRGLYAITPDWAETESLLRAVDGVLAGGVRVLQYRNKMADARLRMEQARALLCRCRRHNCLLIVNDDVICAREVGADGVHLGRDECFDGVAAAISAARDQVADRFLVGVSCYADIARARAAAAAGADYIAFGSFFCSNTKPQAVRADPSLLRQWHALSDLPVVAIGGITLDNAPMLITAGASALAVITDLFSHPQPEHRARAYTSLFANFYVP